MTSKRPVALHVSGNRADLIVARGRSASRKMRQGERVQRGLTVAETTAAAIPTKVIFDGEDQHVTGPPICSNGMHGSKYTFVASSPINKASVTETARTT
jgi:hypothetical protein